MATNHSTYVILSITPTSPVRSYKIFLVSHQKLILGMGGEGQGGETWETV